MKETLKKTQHVQIVNGWKYTKTNYPWTVVLTVIFKNSYLFFYNKHLLDL